VFDDPSENVDVRACVSLVGDDYEPVGMSHNQYLTPVHVRRSLAILPAWEGTAESRLMSRLELEDMFDHGVLLVEYRISPQAVRAVGRVKRMGAVLDQRNVLPGVDRWLLSQDRWERDA